MFELLVIVLLLLLLLVSCQIQGADYMNITLYQSGAHNHTFMAVVRIGSPPQDMFLSLDASTDLVWSQCNMPKIPPIDPVPHTQFPGTIYDVTTSKSYSHIFCDSSLCPSAFRTDVCNNATFCLSSNATAGEHNGTAFLGMDRLIINEADYSNLKFSCVPYDSHFKYTAAGVLGLGRGDLSFVSQLIPTFGNRFSYCLPPHDSPKGYFTLGNYGGKTVIFTPLIVRRDYLSLYFVRMESITIAGDRVTVDPSQSEAPRTIVDPGTFVTSLPTAAYKKMSEAFLTLNPNHRIAESYGEMDLCFDTRNGASVLAPSVLITFAGEASIELDSSRVVFEVDSGKSCLGFRENIYAEHYCVFGGMQQRQMEVVFDLANQKLGFRLNALCDQ